MTPRPRQRSAGRHAALPLVLVLVSEKGGVTKTTLAALLAMAAARSGARVTAVDLDPRHTLTKLLGAVPRERGLTVDAIIGADPADDITGWADQLRVPSTWDERLTVLPSERSLGNREKAPADHAEYRLADALDGLDTDLIVVDTPPRPGGVLVLSGLAIPRARVLYATTLDQDGLDGIAEAWRTVQLAQQHTNPELQTIGIAASRVDLRRVEDRRCEAEIIAAYGENMLLRPLITETVIVREGRAADDWVGNYDRGANTAEQADQLWIETRRRLTAKTPTQRKDSAR